MLAFFTGTGGNGKSVLVNVISEIMGDYAEIVLMEVFTESGFCERHPTELISLAGKRLVTANEIEEGRRWKQERVLQVTGWEKISSRFMRQDLFK